MSLLFILIFAKGFLPDSPCLQYLLLKISTKYTLTPPENSGQKKQCLRCPLLISPQGYTKPPATPSNTCSNKNGQFDKISSNQVNVPPFTYSCIIQRRRIKHVNACKSTWNPKRASTIHKALTIVPRYPHMTVAPRCRDRIPHQHNDGIPVISSPMHIGMVMTVIKPKLLIKKKIHVSVHKNKSI